MTTDNDMARPSSQSPARAEDQPSVVRISAANEITAILARCLFDCYRSDCSATSQRGSQTTHEKEEGPPHLHVVAIHSAEYAITEGDSPSGIVGQTPCELDLLSKLRTGRHQGGDRSTGDAVGGKSVGQSVEVTVV